MTIVTTPCRPRRDGRGILPASMQPLMRRSRGFVIADARGTCTIICPILLVAGSASWVHRLVIILFVAAVVLLAIENLQLTTMSFLGFSLRAALAILAVVDYVLGAFTGGNLFALLRATIQATNASWPATSQT